MRLYTGLTQSRFFMASSIWEFSKLSRYIWVTFSELWPRDSEMIAVLTPERFSTVAYE